MSEAEGIYLPCAPFLYLVSDSAGRRRPGMEITSRSPGPFRYLEQAKSLVALHELQHEVGALLEFRDLVMETFPHLRDKMASPSATSTLAGDGVASARLPADRREWEPGVRVRRKLSPKGAKQGKQPKSGETLSTGSAVQDSGFSTETSSKEQSKEGCVVTATTTALATSSGQHDRDERDEAEDELWNLLDVIQRKGSKLRDEVEVLQKLQDMKEGVEGGEGMASLGPLDDALPRAFKPGGSMRGNSSYPDKIYPDDQLREVKFERDYLMDKMSEMEAETLAARVRAEQLTRDVAALAAAKRQLEEQLRATVLQKGELNSRIHELHTRFVSSSAVTAKRVSAPDAPTSASAFAPVPARSVKQSPPRSIQQSPPRLIEQSPTLSQSIRQSPPLSIQHSAVPIAKQALTRSNTFEVSRATKPTPAPASVKQSPTRSDTFSVSGPTKQHPVRPTAIGGSVKQSAVRPATGETTEQSPFGVSILQLPTESPRQYPAESTTQTPTSSLRPSPSEPMTRAASISPVRLRVRLGALDGIVSCPATLMPGPSPDRHKMAAVLRETSRVELQRHLLVTCVENQRLSARLDAQDAQLRSRIAQLTDSNDELSFRLAEREIELESARAQIRILDRGTDTSLPTSRLRRPSKIPKSSAPKPPPPTAAPPATPSSQPVRTNDVGSRMAPQYVNRTASKSSLSDRSNSNASLTDRNLSTQYSANRSVSKSAFVERCNPNVSLTDRNVSTLYSASRNLSKSTFVDQSSSNGSLTDRNVAAPYIPNRNLSKSSFTDRSNSNGSLTDRTLPTHPPAARTVSNGSLSDRSIPRPSAPSKAAAEAAPSTNRTIPSSERSVPSPSLPSRTCAPNPAPLATRTVSNPSLTGRTLPRAAVIVGGNRVATAPNNNNNNNNNNKKKSADSSRRVGGGTKRDVSIGYRKEGRRTSTKDDGPALVDGKQRENSVPWTNDSSSEYFDSINESGSLLLDSAEPSHWLAMQREAMAECDSLELRESNQWGQSN